MLLPMPRATTDELALRVHLALATMRAGVGSVRNAQTVTQTMILAGFIAEAGYGAATYEQLVVAEAAISAAFDRGRDRGANGDWMRAHQPLPGIRQKSGRTRPLIVVAAVALIWLRYNQSLPGVAMSKKCLPGETGPPAEPAGR